MTNAKSRKIALSLPLLAVLACACQNSESTSQESTKRESSQTESSHREATGTESSKAESSSKESQNTTATKAEPVKPVPTDELEFLDERVADVTVEHATKAHVAFARSSRNFVIDSVYVADPAALIAQAQKAAASGERWHATVYDPNPRPKSAAARGQAPSARLLRLDRSPDPRQR